MWSVAGSFLKFGRNATICQYGSGNVLPLRGSSPFPFLGVDHLSSRSPLHRLGEGQGRGGKRFLPGPLTSYCAGVVLSVPALDFVHPHVEWKAKSANWAPNCTKVQYELNLARIGPNLAPFSPSTVLTVTRLRVPGDEGKTTEIFVSILQGLSLAHLRHHIALWTHLETCWENRPLNAPTWGVAPRFSNKRSEKVFWCRGCASALIICHYSAEMVLIFNSTLATLPGATPSSNKCQRRRESAHQRSLPHVGAFPPFSAPPASLSSVMNLTPWVELSGEVERGRTKSVPGGVNPRAVASFAMYFAL